MISAADAVSTSHVAHVNRFKGASLALAQLRVLPSHLPSLCSASSPSRSKTHQKKAFSALLVQATTPTVYKDTTQVSGTTSNLTLLNEFKCHTVAASLI